VSTLALVELIQAQELAPKGSLEEMDPNSLASLDQEQVQVSNRSSVTQLRREPERLGCHQQ